MTVHHDPDPRPPTELDSLPLLLTITEAAVLLRLSRSAAYKLAELWEHSNGAAGLPVLRLGRRLVVRRSDLAALVGYRDPSSGQP